jgi:hypothetical protein
MIEIMVSMSLRNKWTKRITCFSPIGWLWSLPYQIVLEHDEAPLVGGLDLTDSRGLSQLFRLRLLAWPKRRYFFVTSITTCRFIRWSYTHQTPGTGTLWKPVGDSDAKHPFECSNHIFNHLIVSSKTNLFIHYLVRVPVPAITCVKDEYHNFPYKKRRSFVHEHKRRSFVHEHHITSST